MYSIDVLRLKKVGSKRIKTVSFTNVFRVIRFYKRFKDNWDFIIKENDKILYNNI